MPEKFFFKIPPGYFGMSQEEQRAHVAVLADAIRDALRRDAAREDADEADHTNGDDPDAREGAQ